MQGETLTNHGDPANQPTPIAPSSIGPPQRCLLVGASVRWAAQSAKIAGYCVIGMDLFGDTDTLAACDTFHLISPEEASQMELLRVKVDAVAAQYQARPWLVGGLGGLLDDRLSTESGPKILSRLCDGLAISVPPTSELRVLERGVPGRWLVKRTQSCGGLGVRFWDPADFQARDVIHTGNAFLQRFVSGHGYGLVAIANGHATCVLGMTRSLRQRIGSYPFVYSGSFGPCWDSTIPLDELNELAHRVAQKYSIRGLFNLDFVRDRQNQWWLLELNSRPSGSCEVIERSAWQSEKLKPSQSLMGLHIDAFDGRQTNWDECQRIGPSRFGSVHLKQIVFARSEGLFQMSSDVHGIADIPSDQTHIDRGHPIATSVSRWTGEPPLLWKEIRANSRRIQTMVKPTQVGESSGIDD